MVSFRGGGGEEEEENHQRMNVGCKAFTALVWQTNTGTYIRLSLGRSDCLALTAAAAVEKREAEASAAAAQDKRQVARVVGLEVEVELLSFPLKLFTGRACRRCRRSLGLLTAIPWSVSLFFPISQRPAQPVQKRRVCGSFASKTNRVGHNILNFTHSHGLVLID